jgi:hypothetical protein
LTSAKVIDVRFVEGKAGSAQPQGMHASGPGGHTSQDIHDWTGQIARYGHLLPDVIKLLVVGKVAMPEEIGRLLKREPAHQFVDIIATDDQPPGLSIDLAQLGSVSYHALQTMSYVDIQWHKVRATLAHTAWRVAQPIADAVE